MRRVLTLGMLLLAPALWAHNVSLPVLTVGTNYYLLGLDHLWGGWDHIAFLAGLVLPGGRWGPMLKTVTAFTISHSLTLALVATGKVVAASWWVEPMIALTIVIVALEALRPPKPLSDSTDRRFEFALCFGLVHGMGFAGALLSAGLPPTRIVPALLGFNLGLETAQILIVLALLPVVLWLKDLSPGSYRGVLRASSLVIAVLGSVWFLERIGGVQ